MFARGRARTPLAGALVALGALALALSVLLLGAPAARASEAPRLVVTDYEGVYDGQPHSAVSIVGDMGDNYYLVFVNKDTGEAHFYYDGNYPSFSFTDVESTTYLVEIQSRKDGGYVIAAEDFTINITPRPVTVSITGNSASFAYDGQEHSVEGYAFSCDDALYTEADFSFAGTAKAARTDAGTTAMGLSSSDFVNDDANFDVTFDVVDGGVTVEADEDVAPAADSGTAKPATKAVPQTDDATDAALPAAAAAAGALALAAAAIARRCRER